MGLQDPSIHPDWLQPHSLEWYKQLGKSVGNYTYPWDSIIEEPNGESVFDDEVRKKIRNKDVLDVGCGHGDFTIRCGNLAKTVTGFDVTEEFITKGNISKKENVTFVLGNIKNGLPFRKDQFDCAYIRKGPTSAYPLLKNVVKKGGIILGLHPGDDYAVELSALFPYLFPPSNRRIIDGIEKRLKHCDFSRVEVQKINSTEYLQSPIDVIKLHCFGQKESIFHYVLERNFRKIKEAFIVYASYKGLPITFSRYIVRAKI